MLAGGSLSGYALFAECAALLREVGSRGILCAWCCCKRQEWVQQRRTGAFAALIAVVQMGRHCGFARGLM